MSWLYSKEKPQRNVPLGMLFGVLRLRYPPILLVIASGTRPTNLATCVRHTLTYCISLSAVALLDAEISVQYGPGIVLVWKL